MSEHAVDCDLSVQRWLCKRNISLCPLAKDPKITSHEQWQNIGFCIVLLFQFGCVVAYVFHWIYCLVCIYTMPVSYCRLLPIKSEMICLGAGYGFAGVHNCWRSRTHTHINTHSCVMRIVVIRTVYTLPYNVDSAMRTYLFNFKYHSSQNHDKCALFSNMPLAWYVFADAVRQYSLRPPFFHLIILRSINPGAWRKTSAPYRPDSSCY